jgi:hypothetical protein
MYTRSAAPTGGSSATASDLTGCNAKPKRCEPSFWSLLRFCAVGRRRAARCAQAKRTVVVLWDRSVHRHRSPIAEYERVPACEALLSRRSLTPFGISESLWQADGEGGVVVYPDVGARAPSVRSEPLGRVRTFFT